MSSSRAPDVGCLVGTVVDGRYRIEEVAGSGGHGVVYRALHLGLDVPVAVKVLRPPQSDDHAARDAALESFRREGRLLSQLSSLHPAFVQAREAGTVLRSDGNTAPYLVLEWLEGVGLDHEIKERRAIDAPPLELAAAVGLLDDAAQGLALAHARGISHRDLKPGNLFVVPRDDKARVKILDFGLAKVMETTLSTAARFLETRRTMHSFTHAYGAPEQWLSRLGASGPWTDVHAWALICVELVSGKPALHGQNSEQLMGACLDARRPTLRNAGVSVSDAVEAVFARALAVQPSERYPHLGAFWRALGTAAGSSDVPEFDAARLVALPPIAARRTARPSVIETAPPTAPMSERWAASSRPARHRQRAHAALGAAALLCGTGAWLALRAAPASRLASDAQVERSLQPPAESRQVWVAPPSAPREASLAAVSRPEPQPSASPTLPRAPGTPQRRRAVRAPDSPATSPPPMGASQPTVVLPAPALVSPSPLPSAGFRRFD